MTFITAPLLVACGVHADIAAVWSTSLATQCAAHAITTTPRAAEFLANILHETGNLKVLVENLDYSAAELLDQWPEHFTPAQAQAYGRTSAHRADQVQIAEHAYGGRMGNGPAGSGDGWLFRGHGAIETTGRAAYAALAKETGRPIGSLPAWLLTPAGGAESATRFWGDRGCNAPADRGDVAEVRRLVNGGAIGLAEVEARYATILRLLGGQAAAPVHAGAAVAVQVAAQSVADALDNQFNKGA